jgi:hypothetical protein
MYHDGQVASMGLLLLLSRPVSNRGVPLPLYRLVEATSIGKATHPANELFSLRT